MVGIIIYTNCFFPLFNKKVELCNGKVQRATEYRIRFIFLLYIYYSDRLQILLTNYKHTQPTLGLSVTFVFNIEYIYFFNKENKHTCITK